MSNELTKQTIADTLETNYMPYAMSVIVSRAIPEIDGFKPSHRKLLYTMYKMNLLSGNRTKSANIVGQTMKLNPHGDAAIYETMVRLTRAHEALLHPLVDSKGNFGKQYSRDMAYAASRYTEAKLSKICAEIFRDIDKNTVDFTDNYDGTVKEPLLLPTAFPNVLVNPNQGIAVGMASNICSFNLREVCDTAISYLKHPRCEIAETLLAPDFPTGGQLIYDKEALGAIYETGRGTFKVRAKYRYDKKSNCIEITEIPYTTTCEAIIDKIVELVKGGKLREITDARDETDLSGLKLALDLKRGVDPDKLMTMLYKVTPLEDSFGCNFNILIDGTPKVMGIRDILKEWTLFRMDCIRRQISYDIQKKADRLHLLEGLSKILLDIDKAIAIIRGTEEDAMVVPNLMEGFSIDQVQAEFIAEIKLRNLNKDYLLKRVNEEDSLRSDLAELRRVLEDEKEIKKIIIGQLKEISKKYGEDRKTEIISPAEVEEYKEEAFVDDYRLKIFFTKENYLKKIPLTSLRSAGEHKLKENDVILEEWETGNAAELILFSNKETAYKLKIADLADSKASTMGDYLPSLLGLEEGERILSVLPVTEYKGFLLFAFQNGKVAKVDLACYETKTNRKKLVGAYSGKSPLVGVQYAVEEGDYMLYSSIDKVLLFSSKSLMLKTTRSTQGVAVMNLKKKSTLVAIKRAEDTGFSDNEQYRARNIPATGYYLSDEDSGKVQMTLFD